jgi:hypothetical protein
VRTDRCHAGAHVSGIRFAGTPGLQAVVPYHLEDARPRHAAARPPVTFRIGRLFTVDARLQIPVHRVDEVVAVELSVKPRMLLPRRPSSSSSRRELAILARRHPRDWSVSCMSAGDLANAPVVVRWRHE